MSTNKVSLKATGRSLGKICLLAAACLVLFTGCARIISSVSERADVAWLQEGSVVISRPAPSAFAADLGGLSQTSLGFLPSIQSPSGAWILIDTLKHTVNLMDGEKTSLSTKAQGIESLKPGKYQLLHKQRNPLWYAPSSYFSERKLEVPAEGDKERFRRGALGDFVLYLDKDTPIHSGPVWSRDIGGLRVDDNNLSKMYYLLNVGAPIEVR